MTTLGIMRSTPGRYLVVDTAEWLTCIAFTALAVNASFGTRAAAVFLIAGGLLIVSNLQASIRSLLAAPLMLVLPAYCLLSTLWSQFPDITLRYSFQMLISIAIGIVITGRVSLRLLMRVLFVTYWIGVIASLLLGGHQSGGAWQGIFGSKNAFAAHLAVFALISLAVAFDRLSSRSFRLGGILGVVIAGPLLLKAESAGALVAIVPCIAVMVLVMMSRGLSGGQKLFAGIIGTLAAAGVAMFIIVDHTAIMSAALSDTGKDATLTGRTDLWAAGLQFIAEHPWLGLGYRAFWVKGFAPAEQFWAMFGVQSGAGFNFHDLYISNTVELGLVGMAIEVALIYGGLILAGTLAVVRPSPTSALLLGLQLLLVLRSFIEVEVFFEFSIRTILAICTVIYAFRGVREWRRQRAAGALALQVYRTARSRYIREAWRHRERGALNGNT